MSEFTFVRVSFKPEEEQLSSLEENSLLKSVYKIKPTNCFFYFKKIKKDKWSVHSNYTFEQLSKILNDTATEMGFLITIKQLPYKPELYLPQEEESLPPINIQIESDFEKPPNVSLNNNNNELEEEEVLSSAENMREEEEKLEQDQGESDFLKFVTETVEKTPTKDLCLTKIIKALATQMPHLSKIVYDSQDWLIKLLKEEFKHRALNNESFKKTTIITGRIAIRAFKKLVTRISESLKKSKNESEREEQQEEEEEEDKDKLFEEEEEHCETKQSFSTISENKCYEKCAKLETTERESCCEPTQILAASSSSSQQKLDQENLTRNLTVNQRNISGQSGEDSDLESEEIEEEEIYCNSNEEELMKVSQTRSHKTQGPS